MADRPSVVVINTPQVFHGIRADVTVPELSRAFERVVGVRPRFLYSSEYILPGTTIDIYCSGITAFEIIQVISVIPTRLAGVFASFLS